MDSLLPLWFLVIFIIILPEVWSGSVYLQPPGASHDVFTNDSFFISCNTQDSELRKQLEWLGPDGNPITATSGRLYVENLSLGNYSLGLVVEQIRREDAGRYTCTARSDPSVAASTTFVVYQAIDFMDTPLVQTTQEDRNYTVKCHVQAHPTPKPMISWHVNGQPPNNKTKYHQVPDGLVITKVTREDAGNYTCRVISVTAISQIKEITIRLDVLYGPEWKRGEGGEEVYGTVGAMANLSCQALGVPRPTYEWLRNGEMLKNGSLYTILHTLDMSVLQVEITDASLFDEYVCKARGSEDPIEKSIGLLEGKAPGAPVVTVEGKGPETVNLKVVPPKESNPLPVLGYRVEYRPEELEDYMSEDFEISSPQPISLKNLDHSTVYVLRAASRNVAGHGEYSEEITVKTQPASTDSITGAANTVHRWVLSAFFHVLIALVL